MVNLTKLETEAKSIVAETESAASGILGTISPQWAKFVTLWKSWSLKKKIIGGIVIGVSLAVLWAFSVDIGRLVLGSYRSAYTYGHSLEVDPSEVKGDIATALKGVPSKADFDALTARVTKLETEKQTQSTTKIMTGVIPKKKVPVKPASSFFQF
jgi:hypothetical protein